MSYEKRMSKYSNTVHFKKRISILIFNEEKKCMCACTPFPFYKTPLFGKEVCNHINCKFQLNVHIPLLNLCQTNIPKSTQFLQRNDFAAKSFHLQSIQLTQPRPPWKKNQYGR